MTLSSFKSLLLFHEKGTVSADFFKKRVDSVLEIVTREKKRVCSTPFQTSPASLSYLISPLFSFLSMSLPSSLLSPSLYLPSSAPPPPPYFFPSHTSLPLPLSTLLSSLYTLHSTVSCSSYLQLLVSPPPPIFLFPPRLLLHSEQMKKERKKIRIGR